MLNISAIVAGVAFVRLPAANVVVMLEASQLSRSAATRSRLIAVHRAGGYLFVILLCIMAYSMTLYRRDAVLKWLRDCETPAAAAGQRSSRHGSPRGMRSRAAAKQ